MLKLIVVDQAGAERQIEAIEGISVMEAIRDAGFDELLAQCGGCGSCATCHVIVDEAWFSEVGEPNDDESEMLEISEYRVATSRLSCQIEMSQKLDGLRVVIAPEE